MLYDYMTVADWLGRGERQTICRRSETRIQIEPDEQLAKNTVE